MEKPLPMLFNEGKQMLYECVNELMYTLPPCIVDELVSTVSKEVHEHAVQDLLMSENYYKQGLEQEQKQAEKDMEQGE